MYGLRPIAVVDIDGVIADVRHRTPLIEGNAKAWEAFYSAGHLDPVISRGVFYAYLASMGCDIHYLTGMPERFRADRERWLCRARVPFGILQMRSNRDYRPAWEYKWRRIEKIQDTTGQLVHMVVDDDPRITHVLSVVFPTTTVIWVDPEVILKESTDGEAAASEGRSSQEGSEDTSA
jgi:hypothetical protein